MGLRAVVNRPSPAFADVETADVERGRVLHVERAGAAKVGEVEVLVEAVERAGPAEGHRGALVGVNADGIVEPTIEHCGASEFGHAGAGLERDATVESRRASEREGSVAVFNQLGDRGRRAEPAQCPGAAAGDASADRRVDVGRDTRVRADDQRVPGRSGDGVVPAASAVEDNVGDRDRGAERDRARGAVARAKDRLLGPLGPIEGVVRAVAETGVGEVPRAGAVGRGGRRAGGCIPGENRVGVDRVVDRVGIHLEESVAVARVAEVAVADLVLGYPSQRPVVQIEALVVRSVGLPHRAAAVSGIRHAEHVAVVDQALVLIRVDVQRIPTDARGVERAVEADVGAYRAAERPPVAESADLSQPVARAGDLPLLHAGQPGELARRVTRDVHERDVVGTEIDDLVAHVGLPIDIDGDVARGSVLSEVASREEPTILQISGRPSGARSEEHRHIGPLTVIVSQPAGVIHGAVAGVRRVPDYR